MPPRWSWPCMASRAPARTRSGYWRSIGAAVLSGRRRVACGCPRTPTCSPLTRPADNLCIRTWSRTGSLGWRSSSASGLGCMSCVTTRPLSSSRAGERPLRSLPLLSVAVPRVPPSCRLHQDSERPVGLSSLADSFSNIRSISWFGGDLARPGLGPADRSAAGAVRGAARRRPRHRPRAGRQG